MKKKIICVLSAITAFVAVISGIYVFHHGDAQKYEINEYMQEYDPDMYEPLYVNGVDLANNANRETNIHVNPDYRAWISIPEAGINYPVCQGVDNDFYLNHDFDGNANKSGCIFIDYQSKEGDKNTVVYGHNFGSESTDMFSTLLYYENPDWYNSHRAIEFSLNEQYMDMRSQFYKIFAVVPFNTANLDSFDYMQRNWYTQEEYADWLNYIYEHSLYDIDADIPQSADILTLSTCNRRYGANNRFLIFAYEGYTT